VPQNHRPPSGHAQVLPLEQAYKYAQFHSSSLNPADFDAKPMVLLLGQYSVGKTSFIRSLLKRDFPGKSPAA
jgi:GTP-binding protein EngB required for normal cell division